MAAPREALLEIEGMTCASCVARVEKRLQSVDGVTASVNLATEQARVTYPDDVDPAELVAAVRSAGYEAHVRAAAAPAPVRHRADHERVVHETDDAAATAAHEHTVAHEHDHSGEVAGGTTLRTRLIVSAALAVPVVATGMVPAWQFPGWQWVSLVLTTPIVLWGGWPFHRATFRGARHGALTMDTLITLGTFAAYLWSVWALIWGSAGRIGVTHEVVLFGPIHDATALVYFEVAAAVTVFLLLGRLIEQRSKRRAGAALRALLDLAAKDVEREDGTRVPVDALRPGDRFIVRPGEKIATDGIVRGGRAAVDESMMTGESVPVELAVDAVATGGTLVVDGRLVVAATAVGAETRLARIARLVEDAQAGKSRVQRLADRISGVFVPIVIALAVLTLIGWVLAGAPIEAGFVAAVAVLIIACPCALGLATPIAILVGTGRGAQRGVLITGPEAVEDAARVDTVVLDKTGTVTQGRMEVREVLTTEGTDAALMRRLVGSLEHASEHPLARAVTATADTLLPVTDFTGHAGHGVTGRVDGRDVFAGTLAFATGLADGADAVRDAVAAAQASGATTVVAGWDRRVRGVFAVADRIREDAADTVRALRARGIDVVLLTGDNAGAAAAVAREAGIDRVVAEVLPEDKAAEVRRLQAEGHRVAMVGDGVNDAAALATADVGIAMGGGTDAAMHAGDIALTGGGLGGVLTALTLSRRTMRVIRGNLFWAFAYNVAALPLAVLGLLNPMVAGAAMAFSSVFVVLNSLRLRRAV